MKFFLFNLFFITVSFLALAQKEKSTVILPFDKEKYESFKLEEDTEKQDSALVFLDSIPLIDRNNKLTGDMTVYSPQGNMAPMSQMEIKKDVNYTMQVKEFSNKYPYKPDLQADSIKIRIGKPLIKADKKDE